MFFPMTETTNTEMKTSVVRDRPRDPQHSRRRWRNVAIASAGLLAFIVTASAATLGGLGSGGLGSEDAVVAACDSDGVAVDYTVSYDAVDGRYEVASADVSGIAATCVGQTLEVALRDGTGALIGNGSLIVAGATESVAVANVSAAAVEAVSVAIYS